jgi:hypothetical protein
MPIELSGAIRNGTLSVCDRIEPTKMPKWVSYWPEWMQEEGMELAEAKEG